MIAVWTSLSSDTVSSDHIVGSLWDEATTRILEPLDDVACYFSLNTGYHVRTHSVVPSYILKGSHAPLYLSTPRRLHSSLKQCILLLGRCFLVLLLSDRPRLSLLLVIVFHMSFSIKQKSMIAHIVCAPLFVQRLAYCAMS